MILDRLNSGITTKTVKPHERKALIRERLNALDKLREPVQGGRVRTVVQARKPVQLMLDTGEAENGRCGRSVKHREGKE